LGNNCEGKELEATITLEYDDVKVAEAVAGAVSPDNYKTPANLTVKTAREQNVVLTEIKAEGKMATFIATIDDLLFSVSVAEKTLKVIQ
jgi:tRNA threonylcarbamoyladenosine modification (KEOPS) complex  Pcc1 subunit